MKKVLLYGLITLLLVGAGCRERPTEMGEAAPKEPTEVITEVLIKVLTTPQRILEGAVEGIIEGLELPYTHYQNPTETGEATAVEIVETTVTRNVNVTIEFLGEPVETLTATVVFNCVGTDTATPAAYRNAFRDPAPLPYCFVAEVDEEAVMRAIGRIVGKGEEAFESALNLDQAGLKSRKWYGPSLLYEMVMLRDGDSEAYPAPDGLNVPRLAIAAIERRSVILSIRLTTESWSFSDGYRITFREEAGEYLLTLVSPKESELVIYLEEAHFRSGGVPPNVDIQQFGVGMEEEGLIPTVDSLLTSGDLKPVATFMLSVYDTGARVVFGKVLQGAVKWDAALNKGASYIALGNTVLGQRRIGIPEPDLLTKMVWGGVYRAQ